jgi:enoyl-CoA hydratase/carnithine racemase
MLLLNTDEEAGSMLVLYEKKDRIAYIKLNRPDVMNALNKEAFAEFERIWLDFNNDPELRVAIITGSGDKAFCSGMDIKEQSKGLGDNPSADFWNPEGAMAKLPVDLGVHKPIIAAVNGFCIGVGVALILDCDIRIASENASFAVPEVKIGMSARSLGVKLAKTVPLSLTMEMVLTGDRISAQEAYRCGLVSRLVPIDKLMSTAEQIARNICENAPLAVRATKEIVQRGIDLTAEDARRLGDSLNYAALNSEDYREAMRAIREKRKPDYKGK